MTDHLAILKKKWLEKIISGEKTIESRWYKQKRTPYQKIAKGDMLYFKETGKPVTAKATAQEVLFFDMLTEEKIRNILENYGKEINITVDAVSRLLDKKYCTLVVLENVQKIQPFQINKKGYGIQAAWITVDNIGKIAKGNL